MHDHHHNQTPPHGQRHCVRHGPVQIEVLAQGHGPLIVLLPSLGRSADDFDALADAFVHHGLRVLRPAPRGIAGSSGPMTGISLHHLADDIAQVIAHEASGPAIVLGHAFGNWVARMAAADHPGLVRGVVIAAAASRHFDPELRAHIDRCEDSGLPEAERLASLRRAFFADGHDPRAWLTGWHPLVKQAQRAARDATDTASFWGAGAAPMLDLIAADDPFRLPATHGENQREFGARVSVALIARASHALLPEQPAAVAQAVLHWVSSLPHGTGATAEKT